MEACYLMSLYEKYKFRRFKKSNTQPICKSQKIKLTEIRSSQEQLLIKLTSEITTYYSTVIGTRLLEQGEAEFISIYTHRKK